MPENVTGFQPTGNLKKSLIDLAYFDMFPRRSPTFFREEPFSSRPYVGRFGQCRNAARRIPRRPNATRMLSMIGLQTRAPERGDLGSSPKPSHRLMCREGEAGFP
jgi:hypothetical protein